MNMQHYFKDTAGQINGPCNKNEIRDRVLIGLLSEDVQIANSRSGPWIQLKNSPGELLAGSAHRYGLASAMDIMGAWHIASILFSIVRSIMDAQAGLETLASASQMLTSLHWALIYFAAGFVLRHLRLIYLKLRYSRD